MNRREFVISTCACAVGLSTMSRLAGQPKTIVPDLAQLADGNGLTVFNRSITRLDEGGRQGVRLSENAGIGIAYLQGIEFAGGTIEFDVRGKDVQQQSFVGVAFHGVDGTTHDAIFFRPFNLRTGAPIRRVHAVAIRLASRPSVAEVAGRAFRMPFACGRPGFSEKPSAR